MLHGKLRQNISQTNLASLGFYNISASGYPIYNYPF